MHIANTGEGWFQYVVRRDIDHWLEVKLIEDYRNTVVVKIKLSKVHKSTMEYLSILKIDDLENNIDLPAGEQLHLLGSSGMLKIMRFTTEESFR